MCAWTAESQCMCGGERQTGGVSSPFLQSVSRDSNSYHCVRIFLVTFRNDLTIQFCWLKGSGHWLIPVYFFFLNWESESECAGFRQSTEKRSSNSMIWLGVILLGQNIYLSFSEEKLTPRCYRCLVSEQRKKSTRAVLKWTCHALTWLKFILGGWWNEAK